jgi:hypothetical protein
MRQHGEPKFPDPHYPYGFSSSALAALDTGSPRFVAANSTCEHLVPNDGQPTPVELQSTIKQGLSFARCMRRHGVNFPDPGISGVHLVLNLTNVDTNSPAFAKAGHICQSPPA